MVPARQYFIYHIYQQNKQDITLQLTHSQTNFLNSDKTQTQIENESYFSDFFLTLYTLKVFINR